MLAELAREEQRVRSENETVLQGLAELSEAYQRSRDEFTARKLQLIQDESTRDEAFMQDLAAIRELLGEARGAPTADTNPGQLEQTG